MMIITCFNSFDLIITFNDREYFKYSPFALHMIYPYLSEDTLDVMPQKEKVETENNFHFPPIFDNVGITRNQVQCFI
jgi:hypothetical protein